jgi:PAS domain S-box-containing protein
VQDYAIFMVSPAGIITTWNSGAERMTGYQTKEAIGHSVNLLYVPEDQSAGKPLHDLKEAEVTGRCEHEGWRQRRDGSRLLIHSVTFALWNDAKQLTGYSRIIRDITAQEREEGALRSAMEHSVDAIITIDHLGIIHSCGGSFHRIFNYESAELIGRNVNILMPEPLKNQHDSFIANYLQTGIAKVIGKLREVEGLRRDSSSFPLELSISEFTLDGTRFFTGIMRDISVRKQLDAELRQSQKLEAIGQLAGGVAHDFNNLLSIINGYGELYLAKFTTTDSQKKMLEEIINAGKRAAGLTRQLLAFSRKQVLKTEVLNLNEVVINIEKMLRRLIGEDIILTTELAPDLERVKVDSGQMDQVIMNLAVNARDAMPRGGRLTIQTRNIEIGPEENGSYDNCPSGSYVMLTIADTGCGIAPEIRSRMFEPFFTTKGLGKGTGLGLATVFGIVKQSEGYIAVDSEINAGAIFTILLPSIVEPIKATATPMKQNDMGMHGTETVLLVEDEDGVRDIQKITLESFGYKAMVAKNGREAIGIIGESGNSIQLIITDVVMPEMGGRQMVNTIRRRYPDIKVLFMSGYTDDALLRHDVSEANEAFLHKPFTAYEFLIKVRAILDEDKERLQTGYNL